MIFRKFQAGWEVSAPAKVNLFLEVLGKRPDGYHELETLLVPINLFDTLWVTPHETGAIELTCSTILPAALGISPVPRAAAQNPTATEVLSCGPDNLAYRAADAVRNRFGIGRGVRLHLLKRIPWAAGLAGGSSDAAAVLLALQRLWNLPADLTEWIELAATLGSDVPFFLLGEAAVARGRGERLEPVPGLANWHLVVVRPPVGLSTPAVFKACVPSQEPKQVEPLIAAMQRGDLSEVGRTVHNGLQTAATGLSPWIARLAQAFATENVLGHLLSGSGSSYFGVCRSKSVAVRVAARLRAQRLGSVWVVQSCSFRALAEKECRRGDHRDSHQAHG